MGSPSLFSLVNAGAGASIPVTVGGGWHDHERGGSTGADGRGGRASGRAGRAGARRPAAAGRGRPGGHATARAAPGAAPARLRERRGAGPLRADVQPARAATRGAAGGGGLVEQRPQAAAAGRVLGARGEPGAGGGLAAAAVADARQHRAHQPVARARRWTTGPDILDAVQGRRRRARAGLEAREDRGGAGRRRRAPGTGRTAAGGTAPTSRWPASTCSPRGSSPRGRGAGSARALRRDRGRLPPQRPRPAARPGGVDAGAHPAGGGRPGVATEPDLRDHYRLPPAGAGPRCASSSTRGSWSRWTSPGWGAPAYRIPARGRRAGSPGGPCCARSTRWSGSGRAPSASSGSPTGSSIYTPAEQRTHGYYVFPFLLDGQLVGRADLKTDRAAGVLRVPGAFAEPECTERGADADRVATELAGALRDMAGWLGLDDVVVEGARSRCSSGGPWRGSQRPPTRARSNAGSNPAASSVRPSSCSHASTSRAVSSAGRNRSPAAIADDASIASCGIWSSGNQRGRASSSTSRRPSRRYRLPGPGPLDVAGGAPGGTQAGVEHGRERLGAPRADGVEHAPDAAGEHVDREGGDVPGIAVLHHAGGVAGREHRPVGVAGQGPGEADGPPGEPVARVVRPHHHAHPEHRGRAVELRGDRRLGAELRERALLERVVLGGLALAAHRVTGARDPRPVGVVDAHPRDVAVGPDRPGEQRGRRGDGVGVGERVEHRVELAAVQGREVALTVAGEDLHPVDGGAAAPREDGDVVSGVEGGGDGVAAEEGAAAEDEELHRPGYPPGRNVSRPRTEGLPGPGGSSRRRRTARAVGRVDARGSSGWGSNEEDNGCLTSNAGSGSPSSGWEARSPRRPSPGSN